MAVNAYLLLEGIEGPSTSKKKAIDVLSFSFGASNPATFGASGKTSGKVNISSLSMMKVLDQTSTLLFEKCCTGDSIPKAELIYSKSVGDKEPIDYFKIEMTNAVIESVQLSGSSEDPVESLSLNFEKVKVWFNSEKGDRSMKGFVGKGWDLTTLKPW